MFFDLSQIGLDSNCLSYVIQAMEGVSRPRDAFADQKTALVRLYLYTPGTLWTLPTVRSEFEAITDPVKRARHLSWTNVLFGVVPLNDIEATKRRADELAPNHAGARDRAILAEAEDVRLTTLLSYDKRFVKSLRDRARLKLAEPAEFWESLALPRGAPIYHQPHPSNPLITEEWWRW